ncbi:hypothetical protein FE782_02330 [Paenibacillus antri]|uniref:Uncharacterized protein n=1 Tax=Paenibacillus antri TaxID=2582848 RepID=A0A5R9GCK3_9BACL|nr:hypothetical protein [Paenibacillus antri]TLS54202.1 hypothetical protein FE782_02330 [Paenibacillus antri]
MQWLGNMHFTILLLGSWTVFAVVWSQKRRLPTDILLFVFLLMSILESLLFTTAAMSLDWISLPKRMEPFMHHIFIRTVLRPVLYLIAATWWILGRSRLTKWSGVVGVVLARVVLLQIAMSQGWLELKRVNAWHMFGLDVALVLVACLAAQWFLRYTRSRREVS